MLINTIILFLRDALPIFVITTILISLLQKQNIKQAWYLVGAFSSVIFSLILLSIIDEISILMEGTGRELLYAFLYIFCYFISLSLIINIVNKSYIYENKLLVIKLISVLLMMIVMTLNGANFLIYITAFWGQHNTSNVLVTGVVLGAGICTSIVVLLYFLMAFFENYFALVRETLLVLFSTGLLMKATNLLIQVDVLSNDSFLWDSTNILSENSELGQLFSVFFGYEATPTLLQLLIYIFAILLAFTLIYFSSGVKAANQKCFKAMYKDAQ